MTTARHPTSWNQYTLIILIAAFGGCAPAPTSSQKPPATGYTFDVSVAGAKTSGHASTFAIQQTNQSAVMKDGRLTVNDKSYGKIPDGSTIVINNGSVRVNGKEQSPE